MDLVLIRRIWLGVMIAGLLLPFLDTPFLTWRQKFLLQRGHARLILVSLELDFLALWAMAKFFFHWERSIVPAPQVPVVAIFGLLVTLLGAGLAAWAKLRLGRWFSATFGVKEGHVLVTDGPYAMTRHPIYTGVLIALLGSALTWNSLLTLALTALIAIPLFFHTVYEESLFEHHFGAPYLDYQRRVPRIVPFLKPGGAR